MPIGIESIRNAAARPQHVAGTAAISVIQWTSRVLDDQRVGLDDRLAQPDGCVGNAAEGRHRIARALEA